MFSAKLERWLGGGEDMRLDDGERGEGLELEIGWSGDGWCLSIFFAGVPSAACSCSAITSSGTRWGAARVESAGQIASAVTMGVCCLL